MENSIQRFKKFEVSKEVVVGAASYLCIFQFSGHWLEFTYNSGSKDWGDAFVIGSTGWGDAWCVDEAIL